MNFENKRVKNILKSTAFMAFVACFLWSTAFAGIKIGLNYMSPLQFAGLRFFISGLMLLPFVGGLKVYWSSIRANWPFVMKIAFLQTFLMYSLFYTGINLIPASLGAIVVGSGPLFAVVVAHFMLHNDRLTRRSIAAIVLGIAGIALINWGRQLIGIAKPIELLGVFILILNNIVGGLYNVLVVQYKKPIPPMILSSASLLFGGAALLVVSLSIEGLGTWPVATEFYLSLGWLSFLSAAAFGIWFVLLQRPGIKVSYLNSWKFIIPMFGAALSWLLLPNESPDWISIAGMMIIGASLLVMNGEAIKTWLRAKEAVRP
jgi:drug/metabolite transporter (DMT)-like permease